MMRFDRFTERAQDAAQRAAEIIQRFGHNQIDTEHILLALIEQPQGVISQILERLNVDVERLTAFARQVVAEDGRVCELNQQGIRGAPHRHGILLGIEDYVYEFEQWVRDRVGD